MRPAESINRLIKKLQLRASADLNKRVHDDISRALAEQEKTESARAKPNIWRTTVKTKTVKFATAAAIIIAVTFGLSTILDHGATPAYAINQTIEAIKNIPTVHIFGRDWDNKQIEMWVQVDTDTGLMEYCYIDHIDDDRLMVSTPENTYYHNLRTNTVRIKDGPSVSSVFRLGEFFEGMKRLSEKFDGQITYCEVSDLSRKQKVIEQVADAAGIPIDTQIYSVDDQLNLRLNVSEEATDAPCLPVNTQIYFVDDQLNVRIGGFLGVYNNTNEIWTGEVSVTNFGRPNVAFFDENGKKQQIRLVQSKQFSPGKYRLYWRLQEPLHPGQARGGIYWLNDPKKLHKGSPDGTYHLRMNNSFGCEAVENFILILFPDFQVCHYSRDYISNENVDEYGIYIWQRPLPKHRIDNTVDVSLTAK